MKKTFLFIVIIAIFVVVTNATAVSPSSFSYTILNPVIAGGINSLSSNFGLGQSIGQNVVGISTSANFKVWSGFQYYSFAQSNTLTSVAGNGQVILSWTAPHTYLGASVGSYEVGIGSVSGSYIFQNVGTARTFTQTGLTNGLPYYFIIKAKTRSGAPLVFSNEITATPTAGTSGGSGGGGSGGGGGGGGGGSSGNTNQTGAGIVLSGLASPGAKVFVLKDGVQVAQTTADPGASFNVSLMNLNPGNYVLSVYTQDTNGLKSASNSFTVNVTNNVVARVDNLFLAPTIDTSLSQVKKGEPIGVFGKSVPNTQVNVYVHSDNQIITKTNSDKNGAWYKQVDTSFLEYGNHTAQSRAVAAVLLSQESPLVNFLVGNVSVAKPALGTCVRSDLNCDGRVDIIDFSILLSAWSSKNPKNIKTDINNDAIVDITDLSIMLYGWTG